MSRPAILIAATPTSNGDLHVGHLAGPYLAGDVLARYLAATGRTAYYTTCTDDSQSYVVSTAHRQGTTPSQLARRSTTAIERSLAAMGISIPGLPPIDDRYRATVTEFVTRLYEGGRLRERTARLPYATRSGTYLYDGLLTGACPVCLASSSGGACEGCGHPNTFDELLEPRYALDPTDPVEYREHTVLVLPLEEYRGRLTRYYAARERRWRPHAAQLVRELLARPLPDVPVTFPARWGIPAPFPVTPGQVIYPWVEAMPASMYATWWTAARAGRAPAETDGLWRADAGAELVYFHGYDNVFHWGVLDLALLMAHGDRYVLPETNVCNEFYDLDGEKFSTSRGHLVRGVDLLAEVPRDLVRFYLTLTAPEYQRTNFTRGELVEVVSRRLVEPWNVLAEALALLLVNVDTAVPLATGGRGRRMAAAMADRLRRCYELETFSPARAAETILVHLDRLRREAEEAAAGLRGAADVGDLLLQVRTVLSYAAPILVDAADRAAAAGVDTVPDGGTASHIRAFSLPPLPRVEFVAAVPARMTAAPAAARPATLETNRA